MRGTTWILIADSTRARLFEHHRPERTFTLVFEDDRPDLRDREAQRDGDRPGRVHESSGKVRHAMEPHTSHERILREQYARELCERVRAEDQIRHFDNLVLVAPPAMLGVLRDVAGPDLRERVVGELAKDLTKLPQHDLAGHLDELLS